MSAPEDNPADDVQPTREEWEDHERSRDAAAASKLRTEREHKELADKLEVCMMMLLEHILTLRGIFPDHTGIGKWKIFCQNLEQVAKIKIVPSQ